MTQSEILGWLREQGQRRLARLWERADRVRRNSVGDEVHLRGLVEFSNICARGCTYCGLRAGNTQLSRYRMTCEEIAACARLAVEYGYGTVVLQSGDDPSMSGEWLAEVIGRIKTETPLAVTLSVGEQNEEDLLAWRQTGADRYLLRFETSNRALYGRVHPALPGQVSDRIAGLRKVAAMGYETGGGVMVGLPGQTYESLARDVELFRELELDMIGIGPYIPHPAAPLGSGEQVVRAPPGEQAPNTDLMSYKVLALARIACPRANIPSTTALATVAGGEGRQLGLERGANVVMPNLTPPDYRAKYEIYPAKGRVELATNEGDRLIKEGIRQIGRKVGVGRGDSQVHSPAERELALRNYLATHTRG